MRNRIGRVGLKTNSHYVPGVEQPWKRDVPCDCEQQHRHRHLQCRLYNFDIGADAAVSGERHLELVRDEPLHPYDATILASKMQPRSNV